MIILGIDPGLATFGWAIIDPHIRKIVDMGCFVTEPSPKKRRILAADDLMRRARELSRNVHSLCARFGPNIFAAEQLSHPRNSSSAAKLAAGWAIALHEAETRGVPFYQASPQEVKVALTKNKAASKVQVQRAVIKLAGRPLDGGNMRVLPAGLHEHPWDAAAAAFTCIDTSDMYRVYRSGQTQGK